MSVREVYYASADGPYRGDLLAAASAVYGDAANAAPVPPGAEELPEGVSARLYRERTSAVRTEAARLEAGGAKVLFLPEDGRGTARLQAARVLVTRARAQSERLAALLRLHGATPVLLPAIRFAPPTDPQPLEEALAAASAVGSAVFTSATGVRSFIGALRAVGAGPRALAAARLYAVGPATAAALADAGLRPRELPRDARSAGLLDLLARQERGQKALLVGPEPIDQEFLDALRRAGVDPMAAPAYRTLAGVDPRAAVEVRALGPPDFALFYSPSAVRGVLQEIPAGFARQSRIIAVGPTTAAALRACGLAPDAVAEAPSDPAVVDAMEPLWHPRTEREEV